MAISLRMLPMCEETLRRHEVEAVLRPSHRDIEQATLPLRFPPLFRPEVGGDAAVDGVEDEYRFPFLPFGGMDRRQDQIILVEKRAAPAGSLVASGGSSVSSVKKRSRER